MKLCDSVIFIICYKKRAVVKYTIIFLMKSHGELREVKGSYDETKEVTGSKFESKGANHSQRKSKIDESKVQEKSRRFIKS